MTTIASQITSLAFVYSTVYSDADQRKHQSSASLAFVWGIHRDLWIPRTKGQLRGKCFHLMTSSWERASNTTNVFINDVFMIFPVQNISCRNWYIVQIKENICYATFLGKNWQKIISIWIYRKHLSQERNHRVTSVAQTMDHIPLELKIDGIVDLVFGSVYIYIYIYIYNVTAGIDCLQYMNNLGTK